MNKPMKSAGFHFAVLDARDFFRSHGNGLSELMFALGGDHGLDLYCDAACALDADRPDLYQVTELVLEIHALLAACGTPEDRYADPLRWYGGRLTDLSRALR